MSESTLQTLLQQASISYKEGQYQACIALLNDCLLLAPHPAILANRAIAHHKLYLHAEAISDLQQCLKIDHLNYIAHYNLFFLSLKAEYPTAAFQHLCCALSSALTFRCKETRDIATIQRAIHYAYNNKEALLLKGLLHLQKQDHHACLKMLEQALNFESNPVNQAEIVAIANRVKSKVGIEVNEPNAKFIGGRSFQMQTNLVPPTSQSYASTIRTMLSEFNQLLQQLTKSSQTSKMVSMTSSGQLGSSLLEHSISSIKEERISNCITAHNSSSNNQSDFTITEPQKSLTRASYTLFMERQSANWMVASSQNSVIPEESSSVVENWSQSVASSSSPSSHVQKLINLNFTIQSVHLADKFEESIKELYSVLEYYSKENHIFRTFLTEAKGGIATFNDTTPQFELAQNPSQVKVKLYQKIFTRFEDQLLGQGEVTVDTLGQSKVVLYLQGRETGTVVLSTVLVE